MHQMTQPNGSGVSPLRGLSLDRLRLRTSAKWQYYPADVLPLWVAEMDTPIAQPIISAVTDALALGDTGYPSPHNHAFAEAMSSFYDERWGWSFDPTTAAQVTDVMTGVLELVRFLGGPDDAIVLTPPVYTPFFMVAKTLGRPVIAAPLNDANRLDPMALATAFAEATKGGRTATCLISNPHNPTGTVHTRDELEELARLARHYGVRVVSDEIHAPLQMPTSTLTPYLSVANTERDFAVASASKAWNLAGFKAAIVIPGAAAAAEELHVLHRRVGVHPGHIGVIAHTAAFAHCRPWLDSLIADLDANRHLLTALLAEHLPHARYQPPEGTYLAWIDCRDLGLGDDPAKVFLEQGRVAFSGGTGFGDGGAGFVRLNLATSPEILAEAVKRMASVAVAARA